MAMKLIAYNDTYKQAVIDLILSIQKEEFGVAVDLADQPDLQDIHAHYSQFWLAVDEEKGVVGTLGIVKFNKRQAVLKKMFVNVEYRGKSVAQLLLDNLFEYCRIENIKEIYLGTVEQFKAAHRFYEKNNFEPIVKSELPIDFPVLKVDSVFYKYKLK